MKLNLLGACCVLVCLACSDKKENGRAITLSDIDFDRDGYCIEGYQTHDLCPQKATGLVDCKDDNPDINPGAPEICGNLTDDNCDGQKDETCQCNQRTVYRDGDSDTFGDAATPQQICIDDALPTGYVENNTDCDDTSNAVHPGGTEVCGNAIDENCRDGLENDVPFYHDHDNDTFGDPNDTALGCPGSPPTDYVADNTDCDDEDGSRYPGAGGSNDCSATIQVTTAAELRTALQTATPGTLINVASGTYEGQFDVEVNGEANNHITLRGPPDRSAILDGNFSVGSWQGVLTLESKHYIIVENFEIKNTGGERYGVLMSSTNRSSVDGCSHIELRNLHVHNVGEEIIKVQGRNSNHILIEDCIVHTNQDWSAIDVQGHWGGDPPYADKPRQVVIRNNLIYDAPEFAGVGNEFADQIHVYGNVILGCNMGIDLGCGNYNVIDNNLITSFAHFNELKDAGYAPIDLSRYPRFAASEISSFRRARCVDGIALSGNYMTVVSDNEVTDCTGDLILSYDHGPGHNSKYGHQKNLWYRNAFHNNDAARTIREYDKQSGGVTYDAYYFGNLFANNNSATDIIFEHSVRLMFFNNTLVNGDNVHLEEASTDAVIKNNIFLSSGYDLSGDSTGSSVSNNHEGSDTDIFVDASNGNFHLDSTNGGVCIDSGLDLSADTAGMFAAFDAVYATAFDWYDDFAITFDFDKDLDGNSQNASWDQGAYAVPQ